MSDEDMTEEHVPNSFVERAYLITGGLEGNATVAGPLNPEVQVTDSILAFDNRTKCQYLAQVIEILPDGSASVQLQ